LQQTPGHIARGVLTTTVTLRTSNEQKATQGLRFVMTRHNGWWVCEIQQTG
jgi:hypothetical protein